MKKIKERGKGRVGVENNRDHKFKVPKIDFNKLFGKPPAMLKDKWIPG